MTQTDATAAYSTTKGPFYDVRNLPLEVVSEDSHLMPLIIYQVCLVCCVPELNEFCVTNHID